MSECKAARHRRRSTLLVGLSLLLGLAGCTPDNKADGISAEAAKAIRRTDRFQAMATTGERVVAVGAFGTIATSADQGVHWSRIELPGAPALIDVAACGDGSLAALDFNGTVWRADSSATIWTANPVPATDALLAATCGQDNRLWAIGARGALFVSADHGATWADKSLPEDIQLLNIQFPTATDGFVSGEFGRVLVTRDGGITWTAGGALGADFYPLAMHFDDARRGVVVGLAGAVLESSDGGASWVRTKAPTEAPLYGVRAGPADQIVAVGAGGTALRRDGGRWATIEGAPRTDLRGITATAASVMVAGAGAIGALPAIVTKASAN